MSFFTELKRRHVFRVAVLYIVVSWLVLQVADVLMSFLPLSEWTTNLIFLLLVLGFPVAMAYLAYTHEWQPNDASSVHGEIHAIVVLPLENLMNDPEQVYFIDGMHEALIAELSRVTPCSCLI